MELYMGQIDLIFMLAKDMISARFVDSMMI